MSAIVVFGGQVSGKLMSDVGVGGQMSDCVPVVCGATRLCRTLQSGSCTEVFGNRRTNMVALNAINQMWTWLELIRELVWVGSDFLVGWVGFDFVCKIDTRTDRTMHYKNTRYFTLQ